MTLQEKINEEIKIALKEKKDSFILNAYRQLKSDIQYELTKTGSKELDDEKVTKIIRVNIKKKIEALEVAEKVGREDLIKQEKQEKQVFESLLPAEMDENEILGIVKKIQTENNFIDKKDQGKFIGKVMAELKGKPVDGSKVSKMIQSLLNP